MDALAGAGLERRWVAVRSVGGLRVNLWLGLLALTLFFAFAILLRDALFVLGAVVWVGVLIVPVVPRAGLYSALALVLMFEQLSADSAMALGAFVNGGLTGSAGIEGAVATPLELLLLVTLISWLFQGVIKGDLGLKGAEFRGAFVVLTFALVFGLARGFAQGGDMFIALFESRYLFYVPICYFIAAGNIRTVRHVRAVMAVLVCATGLFAIEGAYRKVALIDTGILGVIPEFAYEHSDAIFLAAGIVFSFAILAFRAPARYRVLAIMTLPIMLFTLLASERRAGFIAMIIGFLVFALILLFKERRAFAIYVVPVLLGAALYFPLFWNATGMLGQPARAVRSLSQPDARDAASNLARVLETINVGANIEASPLFGLGFGREYAFIVSVPDLSWWPLWHFVAHNNVLWLWLKLGILGFIAFFVVMGVAVARGVQLARTLTVPELRTFAAIATVGIVAVLVFSYVDIALVTGRVTVFLGVLLGTLAVLERVQRDEPRAPAGA